MRARPAAAFTAAALALAAVAVASGSGTQPAAAKGPRLQAFRSCGELVDYFKRHALAHARLFAPPLGGGVIFGTPTPGVPVTAVSAPAAAERGGESDDFSRTNVQEAGVDEPDIVKSDGRRIFAIAQNKLHAVDVRGARPRLVDSLPLEGGSHELLLHRDRLLVVSHAGGRIEPVPAIPVASSIVGPPVPAGTVLTEVAAGEDGALRIVRTLRLEGRYVSARLVGSTARLVVSTTAPRGLEVGGSPPRTTEEALERSRAAIAASKLANWLPSYAIENARRGTKAERALVQCRHVRRPPQFSGFGMLTVLTIDLAKGLAPVDSDAVLSDAQIVYASPESLYVATQAFTDRPEPMRRQPRSITTALHKFDISHRERTAYRGSGQVSGFLLNQWSLSEHRGVLRVASTEAPTWWDAIRESETFVTTLREREGRLVPVGRVGGLGKGERVYAVRFIGDVGYVVTFRQVDPLYTLDLSSPERPRVLGELKILGYSAYLHPVGEDLILGVGQDATEQGRVLGTQLSLFDVRDLRRPDRLHRKTIASGTSEVEYDHHAFLYWAPARLVVLPVQGYVSLAAKREDFFAGALAFRVGRGTGIDELGRIAHGNARPSRAAAAGPIPIRRSLVVRDRLYTVSELGVRSSDLRTLDDRGWVSFLGLSR